MILGILSVTIIAIFIGIVNIIRVLKLSAQVVINYSCKPGSLYQK